VIAPSRKLLLTAVLFVFAIGTVAAAAATHDYSPLFLTIVPLLGATWVLTRDEPGDVPLDPAATSPGDEARGATPKAEAEPND
jgi:hypothetical protein